MAVLGAVLIVSGALLRLFALWVFRRVSSSPSRDVTPSGLPGTPWFRVQSDRRALMAIVVVTYGMVALGMLLVLIATLP